MEVSATRNRLTHLLQRSPAPGVEARPAHADTVVLTPPTAAVPTPEGKPERSLGSRVLRGVGWTALGTTAALSAIGGLAYVGNAAALREPITVNVMEQTLPRVEVSRVCNVPAAPVTPVLAATASTAPVDLPAFAGSQGAVGVQIPAQTVRQLVAGPLAEQAAQAQQQAQGQLTAVCLTPGGARVEVRLPLPTGDGSLLHVGGFNLPSLGERALQPESVPFQVNYQVSPIRTGLTVEVRPSTDVPEKGPGLLLGAVEARLTSPTGSVPVDGHVQMQADLSQSVKERLGPGQASLLQTTGHQQFDFSARLQTGRGTVASTTYYFWAVPDRTGDGRADVVVTQTRNLDGLKNLEVKLDKLESTGNRPEGWLAGTLHEQAGKVLAGQLKAQLPTVSEQLRTAAEDGVSQQLDTLLTQLEGQLNGALTQGYQQAPAVRGQKLGPVQVSPEGISVGLGEGASPTVSGQVRPGQVAATVDLATVNRELSQSADWNAVLAQARTQTGLNTLEFGRDAHGQPVLPRLAVHDGKLALDADLILGLGPGQTVHSLVSLPVQMQAHGGKLALQPDGSHVKLTMPEQAGNSLLNLLAPRLITSMLAKTQLPGTEIGLPAGLQVEDARVNPGSVTLVLRPSAESSQWLVGR